MSRRGQPQRETLASDFFQRDPWDARNYPALRRNRKGPPGMAGPGEDAALLAALPSPPRTFVFPFVLRALASTRSSTSSPRLTGPSVIRGLHFAKGGTPEGRQGLTLGKSLSSITEVNVAIATPVPYTPLFRGLPASGSVNGSPNDTDAAVDFQSSLFSNADDLGIIVLDRDWFLVVITSSAVVGTPDDFAGYVTVLDQVPAETLARYGA